ncbi:AraC-type DNA-binding protein [Chitinophaga eiseniae]|uniref:AraC-type DNA-binding protein n=1 Tax=Chitinophaga eiseniae TaxID=634771 RepID=A0A1T4TYD9_9BACT|nr:AraC family transcriptional regulator [Chitinophaga eiseniae]SKA45487.1 AraC-type DNA-binding protein [Chitinophaga eiseniae]
MEIKSIPPAKSLTDFVESFWMIRNDAPEEKEIIVLPDGRFDIIFSVGGNEAFHATLRGLDTRPSQAAIPRQITMFAVSFKLLAIEYLLDIKMADMVNEGQQLPDGFWHIVPADLEDFDRFCAKVSATLLRLIKPGIDNRKKELFDLIYSSNGSLAVQELADSVAWSRRQINRYFNEQFGISLKAYCNIFRFKASLQQLKEGRLFPELNYTDQNHFIKEVKKFAGVVPKELAKNQNGRFILLSDPSQE